MNSLGFSPDGYIVIIGSKSGRVILWDAASLKMKEIYDFGTVMYSAKTNSSL